MNANSPTHASDEPGTERLEKAVRAAETALIEYEIAVETFRVEVENFSRLHHQRLGPVYARLDELDAQIAEAVAARTGDPEDIRKAEEARGAVLPMPQVEELFFGWIGSEGMLPEAQAMLNEQPVSPPSRVRPSEEARKAFRDLVRKAHPDLAQDDAERERREAFLVRVNKAYAEGDAATLHALAEEWEAGPLPGPVAALLRSEELYARLEWLSRRKGCSRRPPRSWRKRDRRHAEDGAGRPGHAFGRDRRAAARTGGRARAGARPAERGRAGMNALPGQVPQTDVASLPSKRCCWTSERTTSGRRGTPRARCTFR